MQVYAWDMWVVITNHNTKLAILEYLKSRFLSILILGKEGGVIGDATFEYLL
jgi:hypothetical protein